MGISEILNSLAMIFVMIIPGIILSRKNIINENQSKGISTIIINLTWPCLVIDAMQVAYSGETLLNCGWIFLILIAAFGIALALSYFFARVLKLAAEKAYLIAFMLLFSNFGFIGIPVISALYGQTAVFYASVVEMVNSVLVFTVGLALIQLSSGVRAKVNLKGLLTPGMIGIAIGFCLFLLNLRLPGFLGSSVRLIGAATTPLSMLIIGLQLGRIKIKELFGGVHLYLLSFMKLLIIPGVVFLLLRFSIGPPSLLSKVISMNFVMPVATCTVIFSQQYGSDTAFATKGVLVSTLLSLVTIPIFALLLEL